MAKRLDKYRAYTAQGMKDRSSLPNAADITVGATYIDCVDITVAKIKTILGVSSNDFYSLFNATSINHWSAFGPTSRSITGVGANGVITNAHKTILSEGDFMGYNHNAVTPGWDGKNLSEADIWISPNGAVNFIANIKIGEVNYDTELGIKGVVLAIYENTTLVAHGYQSIDDWEDEMSLTAALTDGGTTQKTYTGKLYFVDTIATPFDGSQIKCQIPNVDNFSVTVKIKQQTYIDWNNISFNLTGKSLALSTGTVSITGGADAINNYTCTTEEPILFEVKLYNWLGQQVGSTVDLYRKSSGTYTAGTDIGAHSASPTGGAYVAGYGYRFEVNELLPLGGQ